MSKKALKQKYTLIHSERNLKKIPNWKTLDFDDIHGFWSKKVIFIYDRLAITMNICLQETDIREWINQGKTTTIQNATPKEIIEL